MLALAGSVWACTAGDSTGPGSALTIGIAPSFQVEPSDFDAGPIDRIRLTARDAATDEVVGTDDVDVDSGAPEWSVAVAVDLGGAAGREVVVEVELLSGGVVEWSGRLGPVTAGASSR